MFRIIILFVFTLQVFCVSFTCYSATKPECLQAIKNNSRDIDLLTECLKKKTLSTPYRSSGFEKRGNSYLIGEKYSLAISDYNNAMDLGNVNKYILYNRGFAYKGLGKYGLALSDFNRCLDLDPTYIKAHHMKVVSLFKQGKYKLAISNSNIALKIDPNHANLYHLRGLAFKSMGKYELALDDYNKAIDLNPKLAVAYGSKGHLQSSLGKFKHASNTFSKALEITRYADAFGGRAKCYVALQMYQKAQNDFYNAVKICPNCSEYYSAIGSLYRLLNIADFDEMKFSYIIYYLQMKSKIKNKHDIAIKLSSNFEDSLTTASANCNIGYAYFNNNLMPASKRLEKAIHYFEKAYVVAPENIPTIDMLARSYSSIGDLDKANFYYEQYEEIATSNKDKDVLKKLKKYMKSAYANFQKGKVAGYVKFN